MMPITEESKRTNVKYDHLEMAYSFVSDTCAIDAAAYICRKTGKIFWESTELDDEFEVPDDIGDSQLYATVPDKRDLDLGTRLVFQFVERHIPECYDRVSNIFRSRGAYGRYKDFLNEHGNLEAWYTFENAVKERALREWAEDEGFTIVPAIVQEVPTRICQFRIEVKGITPLIWRLIQVPEHYSFWGLHVAIQDAMGWLDCHLHAFRVMEKKGSHKTEIGVPDEEFSSNLTATIPGWKAAIIDYFPEVGAAVEYEYDFGDGWVHEVVLEGIFLSDQGMQYPQCIGGKRACPLENCGGVHGYDRLLCALSNPDNEEYEELLIWMGNKFDPDEFNHDAIEFDDPDARWKAAFKYY